MVWLLLPLALSLGPWISTVALLRVTDGTVEGAMIVTASIGALSFLLTGPLVGIVLATLSRKDPLALRTFSGLFFLVSGPTLAFQIFGFGMTVLPATLYTDGALAPDSPLSLIFAAAVGVAWYALFLALFYRSSRFTIWKMAGVSTLLVVVSFVFFATRFVR